MRVRVGVYLSLIGLLAAAPLSAQDLPVKANFPGTSVESDHFVITWRSLHGVSADDAKAMCEALYALWKARLGHAVEPAGKIKLEVFVSREEYEKTAAKGTMYDVVDDGALVMSDERVFNTIALATTPLYLLKAYPKLMERSDVGPWVVTGLSEYFASGEWKGGAIVMDLPQTTEVSGNSLSLKQLAQFNDWVAIDRSFKMDGRDLEINKGVIALQAWATFYWLFNAPGDGGGKGEFAASVPEFLAALEAGQKPFDALGAVLKKAKMSGVSSFDKTLKTYVGKVGKEIPDREEGGWLIGNTAHYTIYIQKGTENRKLKWKEKDVLKDMKFKMELLFTKYAQAFRFHGKLSKRPLMRLYRNKDAYHAAGGPGGSAAYYSPMTKELVGYEDSADTGIVFQIFCHEGCHQFFDLAFPGFYEKDDLPMWFSEGLADCFGSSEIRGKDLVIFTLSGVATWRVETIKVAIFQKQHPSLQDLLDMGRSPFMANGGLHYAQSWSFCHFLWNYPDLDSGKGVYREVLIRLIDGFKYGRPKDEVYRDAFRLGDKPLSIEQLEREWKEYVKKLKTRR